MEKYVVFGPMIIFMGFFLLLILGFFALVGKLVIKGKNQEWKGEVIDKSNFEKKDEDDHVSHILSLKVQLENGEAHNVPAQPDFYNQIKIGDKLEKKKGALWPVKIG
ncbi:hypothetical protein COY87_01440 [Candidatus Roizmanbacteria bacterium CG_4_10_14_0_8_um_filter_33_9]|uniref:DUF7489 domain-containing protein n=1 Tax=Candidatus Roizmanbacteria bacterium CG_4_10_14_0_8_um_filter_33_9 TaxID=1974826 RepID=A0A2M7QK26_9BACT|nr:MAG: hypothetical protein COY87_01440 [Candidatus Roizmanbacteria bacterium CG_4_10_14_0_8_um_filter_33_9]